MAERVEDLAREIAAPVVAAQGLELVDVEFRKEGPSWFLSVIVDHAGGVTLGECEALSNLLDPLMDSAPGIAGKHDFFSVSSPGLDRPLKTQRDFERKLGQDIEVRLYQPLPGKKKVKSLHGELISCQADGFTLKVGGEEMHFALKDTALVRPWVEI